MSTITKDEVIRAAEVALKPTTRRLNSDAEFCHKTGYGQYATDLTNLRTRLEKVFSDWVEEVS